MERIWLIDADGGFIVRSSAGNFSYAYPTSPSAYRAKADKLGKDRAHLATLMAARADIEANMCPAEIVSAHNAHLAIKMDAAIAAGLIRVGMEG